MGLMDQISNVKEVAAMAKRMKDSMSKAKLSINGKYCSIKGNLEKILETEVKPCDDFDKLSKDVKAVFNKYLEISEKKKRDIAMGQIKKLEEEVDIS